MTEKSTQNFKNLENKNSIFHHFIGLSLKQIKQFLEAESPTLKEAS